MKRKLLYIALAVFGAAVTVYIFNETPFLYQEPPTAWADTGQALLSPLAAPIEKCNPKKDTLILFLHGYMSSPHDFARAAAYFAGRYNVAVPLYPGHGTNEQEFQKTYCAQWYGAARAAYLRYRGQYRHVIICGHSLGGALALKLAEEFSREQTPDAVIAIAAPVFFNRPSLGVEYDWRLYFSRWLAWFAPSVRTRPVPEKDQDGAGRVGYQGRNFSAQVHSMKIFLKTIARDLSKIRAPLLVMQSQGDKTAPFQNLFFIAGRVSSPLVKIRVFNLRAWRHTRHLLPLYRTTRDQVIAEIDLFLGELENGRVVRPTAASQ